MPRKVLDAPDTQESTFSKAMTFVRVNVLSILAALLGLAAVALLLGFEPDVGRETILVGLSLLWGAIVGYPTSGYVVGKLGEEPGVFLFDLDAETAGTGALYWFPYTEFNELEVVDGDLDQVAAFLYVGKHVDLEAGTVEGTWRGTLTDRELLVALQAVRECRGMLEEDARRAFAFETNLWSIVYRATKDATLSVVKTFAEGTLPDRGDGVDRAVNDALEEHGLDRLHDRLDDEENVDLDELVDEADGHDRAETEHQESIDQEVTVADD